MIERIVLLQLAEELRTDRDRREVASHSRDVLAGLPGVEEVDVAVAADDPTRERWDLVLRVRFASADDIEVYRVDPDHRRYVDEYLRPRLSCIEAYNFEG